MSALTENLLTGDVNQEYLGDVYKERIRAKIMNELSKNQLIGDDKNKICVEVNDSDLVKDKHQIDEIIAINGAFFFLILNIPLLLLLHPPMLYELEGSLFLKPYQLGLESCYRQ